MPDRSRAELTPAAAPKLRTAGLSVLLGGAIGVAAAVYLGAIRLVEHALWEDGQPRLPLDPWLGTLLLCTVGGLLVGLIRLRHDADTPHDLDDALVELDGVVADSEGEPAPAPPKVRWLVRAALLGVVSLGFGASLGPEAPLLLLATGLGRRVARILRLSEDQAAYISASGALSGLFGGPLGSVVLPVEGSRDRAAAASLMPYGVLASVAGLASLLAVLPDGGGLRYDLPAADVGTGREVLLAMGWGALAAVPAAAAGLILLWLIGPVRALAERLVSSTVLRGGLGGLVLGACGALTPYALFSGEHQGQDLIDEATGWTAWALLGMVALKLLATVICLATGWFGGQIFPAVFSGMALALLVVVVAPDAPVAPVVAAGAGAACTATLRKPLASVLILLFFFPAHSLLALTVGVAVGTLAVQALGDRAPKPRPMEH